MGQLAQTLLLALLFSVGVFMHILSCALFNNWLPITMGAATPACLRARITAS